MLKLLLKAIKSRANWTVVALFVVGGVEAISQFISPEILPLVQVLLGMLTIHFVRNPSQKYGKAT